MDASVDVFAEKVAADPELAGGFNAFGLSQGNNLIRGYIQKYNGVEGYPTAHTFMSICGINAGVGAFPNCNPEGKVIGGICEGITEVLGDLAYNSFVQNILFQANYFRDPSKTSSDKYKKYSQLAQWENEGDDVDESRNEKFAMTEKYVWVLGTEDTVVWPREGEQVRKRRSVSCSRLPTDRSRGGRTSMSHKRRPPLRLASLVALLGSLTHSFLAVARHGPRGPVRHPPPVERDPVVQGGHLRPRRRRLGRQAQLGELRRPAHPVHRG